MKNLKLLLLPFCTLLLLLTSCDKDDKNDPPLPSDSFNTKFEVKVWYSLIYRNADLNQTIIEEEYSTKDVETLMTVVHSKSTGKFVTLLQKNAKNYSFNSDNYLANISLNLPIGGYYITFISFTNTDITQLDQEYINKLKKDYIKAYVKVPNDFVNYTTKEIYVSDNKDLNTFKDIDLNKISKEVYFKLNDTNKAPSDNSHELTLGIKDVPYAFYIATGKTLLPKEYINNPTESYIITKKITIPLAYSTNITTTKFHTLANDNLQEENRGEYFFELRDKENKNNLLKKNSGIIDVIKHDNYKLNYYIYEGTLYDDKEMKLVVWDIDTTI